MGIYQLKNIKTWQNWNSEEEKILRENWKIKGIEEIRKMMPKRTRDSISCKAYSMGITKKKTNVNHLNDFEKGWIAALIDGEGTITLHRTKLKYGEIGYHPRLMIGNTDKNLVEKIKTIVGAGHISKYIPKNGTKTMWTFELSSRPLGMLLPQIKDFLLVKKKQASFVAEVIKTNKTFAGGRRKFMTYKEFEQLRKLDTEILKLNKR